MKRIYRPVLMASIIALPLGISLGVSGISLSNWRFWVITICVILSVQLRERLSQKERIARLEQLREKVKELSEHLERIVKALPAKETEQPNPETYEQY